MRDVFCNTAALMYLMTFYVHCMMQHYILLIWLMVMATKADGQSYQLKTIPTGNDATYRGLSVAADDAVWVSGSKGWVGRSVNGGDSWTFGRVLGYEQCDFRTVYGLNSNNAVIANAGSPAYILRTSDGGKSWEKVYENKDSAAFIDGADFWNRKRGIMHGDPINGRMLLLHTRNGGKTWKEKGKGPKMKDGEASFAASGTSIFCLRHSTVVVATGGMVANLYLSRNGGRRWRTIPTPMVAGSSSTGIYTMVPIGMWCWVIAGGDYKNDTASANNCYYTHKKGKKWSAPLRTTRGYRECLTTIHDVQTSKKSKIKAMIAVGPTGMDISVDFGVNWLPLNDEKGYHVIKTSNEHQKLYVAGSNGKLAIISTTE
jgi:photosystem II stability/assembly factor-like uncharacterized protein